MIVKISVIIPVYKAEAFISRCIDSIINQTFLDFELLLIDDGSPDASGEICDKYAVLDSRIKVFHQENGGVSSARNLGLDNAVGDYVIFIDSDDWIESIFFETYLNELAEYPCGLIYQGFINDYKNKTTYLNLPKGRYERGQITQALFEVEYRECLGGACNKIFHRNIIEKNKIRFESDLSFGEDKIFTLQYCLNIDSISLLDTCYYHYNRTLGSSLSSIHHSSERLLKLIELEYELFQKINNRFPNKGFIEAIKGRYVSIHKYILISMYRPSSLKARRERILQIEKIHRFLDTNVIDNYFDRDVPRIAHVLIKRRNDFALRTLMWMRHNFSNLYNLFRHIEN